MSDFCGSMPLVVSAASVKLGANLPLAAGLPNVSSGAIARLRNLSVAVAHRTLGREPYSERCCQPILPIFLGAVKVVLWAGEAV